MMDDHPHPIVIDGWSRAGSTIFLVGLNQITLERVAVPCSVPMAEHLLKHHSLPITIEIQDKPDGPLVAIQTIQ